MDFSPSHADILQISPVHRRSITSFQDELRSLRRSMSRSPSKMVRAQKTLIDSPPSPSRHSPLSQQLHATAAEATSIRPSSPREPPTVRKFRPTLTRSTPMKGPAFLNSTRLESQSAQTSRRPLSVASDRGNSSPQSSQEAGEGQENQATTPDGSPPDSHIFTVARPKPQNSPFRLRNGRPRSIASTDCDSLKEWTPAKSSPLKRSDGLMNLDQPSFGSPSAKRRSLHGVSSFDIARDDDHPKSEPAEHSDDESASDDPPSRSSLAPRLGMAPRKPLGPYRLSDRATASRNRRSLEMDLGTPLRRTTSRTKSRTSLDSNVMSRNDSTESNDSVHLSRIPRQQPHPLSQALSPTSPIVPSTDKDMVITRRPPGSPDERPTFSRSLPIGALRPLPQQNAPSNDKPFATPKPFTAAKPDPAAFRSTGLISKKHRNPDDMPPPPGGHGAMPDTPCKKASIGFGAAPTPGSISTVTRPHLRQPLFGTPTKPLNFSLPRETSDLPNAPTTSLLSETEQNRLIRSASFISNEGSDSGRSPNGSHGHGESQSSADELPPTPTKQMVGLTGVKPNSKNNSLRSSLLGRRTSIGPHTFSSLDSVERTLQDQSSLNHLCKSTISGPESGGRGTDALKLGFLERDPSLLRSSPCTVSPPFARSSLRRRLPLKASSPLSRRSLRAAEFVCQALNIAKTHPPAVAQSAPVPTGPVPQTPAEAGFPDPSLLTISPTSRDTYTPSCHASFRASVSKPPETPSTSRENGQNFVFPGAITTPSHHATAGRDIDPVLSARFHKVVWYSRGEFSEVYKVYQAQDRTINSSYFSPATSNNAAVPSNSSTPDAVFIVKKSKAPHVSSKLRERKIREASIMQALGRNEHIVRLIASWEANHHLYLQTEFCEEGSLDAFLSRQGHKGRLDDFRIWKIMLEVATGLEHIHNSGFLHLDIKPENIFIDFSGVLKIGDFGLACEWPAPKSIEGEGDRRYIGPDLLLGQFDKPADVFAFGMMMYEIAGNYVLPDNGSNWQKLRSGDFSGLPSLTSGSTRSVNMGTSNTLAKDDSNSDEMLPWSPGTAYSSRPELGRLDTTGVGLDVHMGSTESLDTPQTTKQPLLIDSPATELSTPPAFMLEPTHSGSLDNVVHWMMLPMPADRPLINQVLNLDGCRWVAERRRAGAVVWEGQWGPSDAVLMQGTTRARTCGSNEREPQGLLGQSQGTFFDDADAEMMDA